MNNLPYKWSDEQANDPHFVAAKILLWKNSFWDWFIDNVQTTDESDSNEPVKYAPAYKYLLKQHEVEEQSKITIICKSRRMFQSHFQYAKILWTFLFVPFSKNLIISKKENDVKEGLRHRVLSMYHRLDKRFPCHPPLKQRLHIHEMEILHPDKNFGSHILGLPSGADQIRSYTATRVLIDEFAFHEKKNQMLTLDGLKPAIYGPSSKATIVSTPCPDTEFERLVTELNGSIPIQELMTGMSLAKNKLNMSVIFLKYLADPAKRSKEWFHAERFGTTIDHVPIPGMSGTDEYTWRKEMELSFDFPTGSPVVPEFSKEVHCTPYVSYGKVLEDKPLEVGIDFGSRFPAAVFAQKDAMGRLLVHGGIMPENTNIDRFMQMIDHHIKTNYSEVSNINFYCDPAGAASSGQGLPGTATQVIFEAFGKHPKYRKSGPADRAAGIRKLASQLIGPVPALIVNPHAGEYISAKDGKTYVGQIPRALEIGWVYDENRKDKLEPKKDKFFEHLMDAFGYMFIYLYPHLVKPVKEPKSASKGISSAQKRTSLRR